MRRLAWREKSFFLIVFFLRVFLIYVYAQQPKSESDILIKPDPAKIEEQLFYLINEEREKKGLPRLGLSSLLIKLARQHSQDMAAQNRLSHLSPGGNSYLDRLVHEGLFFIQAGENVARSETFSPVLIHQSMMDSEEHRGNILHPMFDEVGIGVVERGQNVYFITQDFIQKLSIVTSEEARTKLFSIIQEFRQAHGLPPLSLDKEASEIAQLCAQARARNEPQPPIPNSLGETLIVYLITPILDDLVEIEMPLFEPKYTALGIGAAFGRDLNHPGGAYFLTLIFMTDLFKSFLSLDSMRNTILNSMNEIRFASGLNYLRLKKSLCLMAEQIGVNYLNRKDRQALSVKLSSNQIAVFYFTERLELFPEELKPWIRHPFCRNAGIHASLTKTGDFPRGVYFVTLIFD